MPKYYVRNAGKEWMPQEINQLIVLAAVNTPTRVIGLKLGRPENGVRTKASKLGVSLNPINRSPYNRRKS